jgi:hypothetical protein
MKLLQLILFIFAIYFIRRLFQMYRFIKRVQEQQMSAEAQPRSKPGPQAHVVDAEYKVIKDA